jgi:hypothetical protein
VQYPGDPPGLALFGEGCEGLVSLDLTLGLDPRQVTIAGVERAEAASRLNLSANGHAGTYLVSMYGPEPLLASGKLLELSLRGTEEPSLRRPAVVLVSAEANEGRIPVRLIRRPGSPPWPARERPGRSP